MRRANTTFLNLRAALDDLEPLVDDSKPVAKKLRPFLAELRPLAAGRAADVRATSADAAQAPGRRQRPARPHERPGRRCATSPSRDVQRERQGPRGRVPGLDQGARGRDAAARLPAPVHASTCSAGSTTSATPASTTRSAPPRASASTPARSRCSTASSRRSRRSCATQAFQAAASTQPAQPLPGRRRARGRRRLAPVEADAGLQLRPDPGAPGEVDVRRLLVIVLVLGAGAAAVVAARPARRQDAERQPHYTVELDNAFGIVNGADVKVAGVRAGHDHRHARRPAAPSTRSSTSTIDQGRLRLAAHRRVLRDAPAVADRRVLRRLPARAPTPSGCRPARRSRSSRPRRRSRSTWSTTSCAARTASACGIILDELGAGVGGRADDINDDRPPRRPRAARDRPGAGDPRRPEPDARATSRTTPTR